MCLALPTTRGFLLAGRLSKIPTIQSLTADRYVQVSVHIEGRLWPYSCRSGVMSAATLRARIRELMTSGGLPPQPPQAERVIRGRSLRLTRTIVGRATRESYLICGEPDPMLSYTFSDRRVIHLHGACDALWQQERAGG